MILPHSDPTLIVLLIICMFCWGTWPIFLKMAKRYRFELFYFDFAIGLGITALICAFTVGSLGFDGFTFTDDMLNARKQEWVFAVLAAMIFNFGNMLTLASASVAGIAVAFPLAFGVAMVVASWMYYLGHPGINNTLMIAGTALIVVSIILGSSAYSRLRVLLHEALARAGKAKSTRRPSALKGIILALIGGVLLGTFAPLLLRAQDPDDGVGPYSLLFLFAIGVFISTFVLNLFFMNVPVEGDPLEISDYIKTPVKNHFTGLIAGAIWGLGALASFVAYTPKGDIRASGPLAMVIGHAAPVVAGLWGLLVWKEFKPGDARANAFAGLMLVLFAGGVTMFSYALTVVR
ncbi:MAG TPA: GRP family sugar transporter [Bryobacteraceae bacterium]|nr:GRP family sugar transporter [Bryobacteraceae bacterium]